MTAAFPPQSSFATGLRCVCPRCGKGGLYDGLLKVADCCPVCGLDLRPFNADDAAAFFIIVGYSALISPLALWLEFSLSPPLWVHVLVWVPVVAGGAIALMRIIKAWIIAQQFRYGVTDKDTTR